MNLDKPIGLIEYHKVGKWIIIENLGNRTIEIGKMKGDDAVIRVIPGRRVRFKPRGKTWVRRLRKGQEENIVYGNLLR